MLVCGMEKEGKKKLCGGEGEMVVVVVIVYAGCGSSSSVQTW